MGGLIPTHTLKGMLLAVPTVGTRARHGMQFSRNNDMFVGTLSNGDFSENLRCFFKPRILPVPLDSLSIARLPRKSQ